MTFSHDLIKGWITVVTRFHHSPLFSRVWVFCTAIILYTAGVIWWQETSLKTKTLLDADSAIFSGMIMGLLLVFRTNSAYDRWWEARKLWGQLVNDSRNLCLKVSQYVKATEEERDYLGRLLIAFGFSLKEHLRNKKTPEEMVGLEELLLPANHVPFEIASLIYKQLETWKQSGKLDGFEMLLLDTHAKALMDICGACERIKNTPVVYSYRLMMRQGILLNLLALPWYLFPEFKLWCVPLVLISSYFLIGLELIAEDIEEPFGGEGDDLQLDAYCNTIKTSVINGLELKDIP